MYNYCDRRPRRVIRPSGLYLLAAIVITPFSLAVPIVGIIFTVLAWIMIGRRYVFAKRDDLIPYGHFRGED